MLAKKKPIGKTSKVFNWLKPSSPAKGALLFAVAFSVIGGSYMAFRSFAAGNYIINYYNKMTPYSPPGTTAPHTTTESGTLKKGSTVYVVPLGTGLDTLFHVVPSQTTSYRVCATAKAGGSNSSLSISFAKTTATQLSTGGTNPSHTVTWGVPAGVDYKGYCSNWGSYATFGTAGYTFDAEVINKGPTNIRVSSIAIEW